MSNNVRARCAEPRYWLMVAVCLLAGCQNTPPAQGPLKQMQNELQAASTSPASSAAAPAVPAEVSRALVPSL
jgi:hypothetical protein